MQRLHARDYASCDAEAFVNMIAHVNGVAGMFAILLAVDLTFVAPFRPLAVLWFLFVGAVLLCIAIRGLGK